MSDIQLRFNADMLVLSTPIDKQLERLGLDAERDNELMLMLEPEVLTDLYALEASAGIQCLVTDTAHFTPARLAHAQIGSKNAAPTKSFQLDDSVRTLAEAAIDVVAANNPQHILVEIGPCGLPLDASSKGSLNENRCQYERAASYFTDLEDSFDAYFLNGFESCTDLKCALMGFRKKTDKPIFASVRLADNADDPCDSETPTNDATDHSVPDASQDDFLLSGLTLGGLGREMLPEAIAVMSEYGAQVAGFATSVGSLSASRLVKDSALATSLPLLVQLEVAVVDPEQGMPTQRNPYFEPDQMIVAADLLRASGVQFLRAVGNATPSYAGALLAATMGERVVRPEAPVEQPYPNDSEIAKIAADLRTKVTKALANDSHKGSRQ